MRQYSRLIAEALLLVTLSTSACARGDEAVAPTADVSGPGVILFTLQSPHEDDAALWLTVRGGPVDSVVALGFRTLVVSSDSAGASLLVRGALSSETTLQVHVAQRALAGTYRMSVDDAVARGTYERRLVGAYRVSRGR